MSDKLQEERDRWCLIALRFVKACDIDGFDHVRRVDSREATMAYNMFKELLEDLEYERSTNDE